MQMQRVCYANAMQNDANKTKTKHKQKEIKYTVCLSDRTRIRAARSVSRERKRKSLWNETINERARTSGFIRNQTSIQVVYVRS